MEICDLGSQEMPFAQNLAFPAGYNFLTSPIGNKN